MDKNLNWMIQSELNIQIESPTFSTNYPFRLGCGMN